jgi:hypothetical protein
MSGNVSLPDYIECYVLFKSNRFGKVLREKIASYKVQVKEGLNMNTKEYIAELKCNHYY